MKISKKIATLLSCVMVGGCLASCGKKDESSETADTEKTITISEIPQACVTDIVDLSSYVSCQGGSGDFSVTIGESAKDFAYVDISGKKIYVEHSGEVPFTVNYSGKTEQGSVSFVSEEYLRFVANANKGYEYGIYTLDDNWYQIEGFINVYENFYVDVNAGEGYVDIDGTIYSFSLDEKDGELVADYMLTGYEPESIADYAMPWVIDPSLMKSVYVPEETVVDDEGESTTYDAYEAVVIDDEGIVNTMTECIFGYSVRLLGNYGYSPSKVEFIEESLSDGSVVSDAILYIKGEDDGEPFEDPLTLVLLDFSEGVFVSDALIDLFKDAEPHGKDISSIVESFDASLEAKNFEVTYSAGWFKEGKTGMTPVEGNPFVYEGAEDLGYMINHYFNAECTNTAFVTETQTYIEGKDATHSYGIVAKDGNVYSYEGEEHKAVVIEKADSIFDPKLSDEASNYLFLHSNEDHDSLIESIFVNEVSEIEGGYSFTFSGSRNEDLFERLFISAIPEGDPIDEDIEDDIEFLAQFNDINTVASFMLDEDMVKYLSGTFTYVVDGTTGASTYSFEFVWDDYLDDQETKPVYYILTATFSSFGEAEIPAEVVVDYAE